MTSELRYLIEQWDALRQVGAVFALAILIVVGLSFGILHWLFRARLESKDAIIAELRAKLDHRVEELREAQERLKLPPQQGGPFRAIAAENRTSTLTSAVVSRDVSVGEALAYAELHQWGFQFVDAAGMENNRTPDHLERLVQLAADGEICIWGKKNGDGVWIPIPAEHWRAFDLDWFSLLRGEATSQSRTLSTEAKFCSLMASKIQIERVFAPRQAPTMRLERTTAPSLVRIRNRIQAVREASDAEPSIEAITELRKIVAALHLSDDRLWLQPEVEHARCDLIDFLERLAVNLNDEQRFKDILGMNKHHSLRSASERGDILVMIDDALERVEAGMASRTVPPPR